MIHKNISDVSVVEKLRNQSNILNHIDLIKQKEKDNSLFQIGVLELHLTQKCDLKCYYCSYGTNIEECKNQHKDLPFEKLDKILDLNPKAVVLAGGGEPLLYNSGGKDINDLILHIKNRKPDCKIGLITNGLRPLDKLICDYLEWVRISLDATNDIDFSAIKAGDFETRINTIKQFVLNKVKHVGIGMLYHRFNYKNIYNDLVELYSLLVKELGYRNMDSINIQYRATCPIESCNCPSENYKGKILMVPNNEKWWEQVNEQIINKLKSNASINDKFANFIQMNTNVFEALENKYLSKLKFSKCYIALSRWIISSTGDIYPCVIKRTNNSKKIGNIFEDNKGLILQNEKKYYNLSTEFCKGAEECCRVNGMLNNIVNENYYNDFEIDVFDVFF